MGILDRISTLTRANINDLLDRAEDPEKMLNQILRDMETNMQEARSQVAAMIAQEKEIEADLQQTTHLSHEWDDKARRAVAAGKDDLAREALRRKRDNDQAAALYQQQLDTQKSTVEQLKNQLRQLESKYQTTSSQRDMLIARQRRATAQRKVTATISSLSPMDPSHDLERMERRIRSSEARAIAETEMAGSNFDAQFAELDVDHDIEDELAALKAGAGQTTAEPAALPGAMIQRETSPEATGPGA